MSDIMTASGLWTCRFTVAKFHGEYQPGDHPYEVIETDNILMHGGVSALWQFALGNGTATANQALSYFSSGNAAIGVGDGNAAAVATQNNLQGANRLRRGMDASYPQHTDGTVVGAKTITFRSTFDTGQANFAWEEAGVFSSTTDAAGRMLNRKVQSLGVKSNTSSWQATFAIDIT